MLSNTNILLNINNFCTQWSGYKYRYLTLIILFNTIHLHTVKRFQELWFNDSISI